MYFMPDDFMIGEENCMHYATVNALFLNRAYSLIFASSL